MGSSAAYNVPGASGVTSSFRAMRRKWRMRLPFTNPARNPKNFQVRNPTGGADRVLLNRGRPKWGQLAKSPISLVSGLSALRQSGQDESVLGRHGKFKKGWM